MAKHIFILKHTDGKYTAKLAGCEHTVSKQETPEAAVGLLVLLLSHPMGIKVHREDVKE